MDRKGLMMIRESLAACGVAMRNALRGEAGTEAQIRDHKLRTEDEIAAAGTELAAGVAAHGSWLRAHFGVPCAAGRIGLSFAEVSLIGPVPADPSMGAAVCHPLTGADVLAQAQDCFKVEGLNAWPETYRAEVTRMAALLAGGDPHETVRPVHMAKQF